MTSTVGIAGSTQGVASAPAVVAPSSSNSSATSVSAATLGALHNPRVVLDPAAGFITQYLSANGSQVVSQTPSAITVAYLRLGLTADGLSKQSTQAAESIGTTA